MYLITSYLKIYGELLFGIVSHKQRLAIDAGILPKFERFSFVNDKQKEALIDAFKKYFAGCCEYLMEQQKLVKDQEEKLDASRKEIDIDKEIEKKYIAMRTSFDKDWGTLVQMADSLDLVIPQQIEERVTLVSSKGQSKLEESIPLDEKNLWEDEIQRAFYRDLIELKVETKTDNVKEEESKKKEEESHRDLEKILTRLPDCLTKESIDDIAKEFCNIATKNNRKTLVKALFNIQRTALPLIPYYARLAATLGKLYKDIGNNLADMLEKEFNDLYESNDLIKIETKIRNIRFLGELTKFEVCNPNIIFNCMKRCLEDFAGHNIDIVCHLLETTGLYLAKLPATHIRLNNSLDLLWKVAKSIYLLKIFNFSKTIELTSRS